MPTVLGIEANGVIKQPSATLAIVHHANQYLICDGYDNRCGIRSVVGSWAEKRGLAYILELHRSYHIRANIHLSGTLLEALAWHEPQCLTLLRKMYREGLLEFIGSAYGQNIMRFFPHEYNVRQLNEELYLYQTHLDVDLAEVKSFWPPERVWDTPSMAAALRDPVLKNNGFKYVLVDDRLLLPAAGDDSLRHAYDENPAWDRHLFHGYRIVGAQGLIALPIASNLRHCIPPRTPGQQRSLESQLHWMGSLRPAQHGPDFLAIYADDMEKPAGVGWDPAGPRQFEKFLRWVSETPWVDPVQISDWASTARMGGSKVLEGGTYRELAVEFDAGETYDKWYFDRRWDRYRSYFSWAESRVRHFAALGANAALIELAEKHLLASSWETAWHTPAAGAHGDAGSDGGPSGSSRAVASHSRHAAVIAEAAYWQANKDGEPHGYLSDIDNDGEEELILMNQHLFAVISPERGGRLVALFSVDGENGAMVIGNPSDDWNLKEELNDYMDTPPNHPGALADVGFEHDSYSVEISRLSGGGVRALLRNKDAGSEAFGLLKEIRLTYQDPAMRIRYELPANLSGIEVEFGLSPDYLNLLRKGRSILSPFESDTARGWSSDTVTAWVNPGNRAGCSWTKPYQEDFGHGCALRLSVTGRYLDVSMGTEQLAQPVIFEIERMSQLAVEV